MLDLNALFIAANNQQRRMFRIAVIRDSMLLNNAEFENGALHFRGFGRKCSVYLSADAIPEIVIEGVPTYGRKLASFKSDFESRRYDYLEAIVKAEDVKEQIVNLADRYAGGVADFDKESEYVESAMPLAEQINLIGEEHFLNADLEEALRAKFRTSHAVDSNVEKECDLSSKEEVEAEVEKLNDFAEKCSNGRAEPTEESREVEAGRAPIPQAIEERVERNEKLEEQIEIEFSRENSESDWRWCDSDPVDVRFDQKELELAKIVAHQNGEALVHQAGSATGTFRTFCSFRVARAVLRGAVEDLAAMTLRGVEWDLDEVAEGGGRDLILRVLHSHCVDHFDAIEPGGVELEPFTPMVGYDNTFSNARNEAYRKGAAYLARWPLAKRFVWTPYVAEYIGLCDEAEEEEWSLKCRALLANINEPRRQNVRENEEMMDAAWDLMWEACEAAEDQEERERIRGEFDAMWMELEEHDWN